jgi:hypothetical protein
MTGRGKKQFSAYFSIFICFTTKAVHLEAVTSLTSCAFIAIFHRFVSRRGFPLHMYSDQGSNFVGAEREMREFIESLHHDDSLHLFSAERGVTWHFNPPAAPSQGGYWEAGVKSTKYHLKRIVGTTTLVLEEFQTILCQVEAVLNSRPLGPLSPSPQDLDALTPGHFLIGQPLVAIPTPDLSAVKPGRLSRWERVQQIVTHFWTRWHREYLSTLQERNKWRKKQKDIAVGDLVILKEDDAPPLKWNKGRIMAVFPGSDGAVRVVTVKTKHGEYRRSVTKICPLISKEELDQQL